MAPRSRTLLVVANTPAEHCSVNRFLAEVTATQLCSIETTPD